MNRVSIDGGKCQCEPQRKMAAFSFVALLYEICSSIPDPTANPRRNPTNQNSHQNGGASYLMGGPFEHAGLSPTIREYSRICMSPQCTDAPDDSDVAVVASVSRDREESLPYIEWRLSSNVFTSIVLFTTTRVSFRSPSRAITTTGLDFRPHRTPGERLLAPFPFLILFSRLF